MPFISCKYYITLILSTLYTIEKPGKTLHLLKASSKKINPHKKRVKVPLLGTIKEFHSASKAKSSLFNGLRDPTLSQSNYTIIGKDDVNENEMEDK